MKEFLQTLQDAFPILKSHPVLMARLALCALVLGGLYTAKERRKQICQHLYSKLEKRTFSTFRWLYVYQDSNMLNDWKYYTSEVTGKGAAGDDIIWTLVSWPSLKPLDKFKVVGAVGMVNGIHESQAKLQARWQIDHDPDRPFIGPVPARGIRSKLRRASAKVLQWLGPV